MFNGPEQRIKVNRAMKELIMIQQRLSVPKGHEHTFGGFSYRNCEDILTAVKPLLAEFSCSLILTDKLVSHGSEMQGIVSDKLNKGGQLLASGIVQSTYVEATAKLTNSTGEVVECSASAREAKDKPGMDASQISGAASSYARKYALNGLFAIDDVKDADSYQQQQPTDNQIRF